MRSIESRLAEALLFSPLAAKGPSQIVLQRAKTSLGITVRTCASSGGPMRSIAMASAAQHILGVPTQWATQTPDSLANEDLHLYFGMLGNLSESKALLASYSSSFSTAEVWRIGGSTLLMLNNIAMSSTRDEHVYHETLVHPALLAVDTPRRVLIVGGGEGATLREVLRDERIEHITMVDVDEGLVKFCQEHLSIMHQGSFSSQKLKLVFEDGAAL